RDINPHIPQYIKSVPWYLGEDRPTLKHQRPQAEKQKKFAGLDDVYIRGKTAGKAATKFRKGACENCGAMTHKKKDCLERPRRIGAKFTGEDIKPDEILQVCRPFIFMPKAVPQGGLGWTCPPPPPHYCLKKCRPRLREKICQMRCESL
ncbi:pre-mRNA-splicing factor SLU7-like, partial [Rhopilema esculentum]|uniref:pre-mRNA-splicing factor SLU7-like n=1 Tax=Rhopilema esculentum TaxID=499914 RepID=UPI0031D6AA05